MGSEYATQAVPYYVQSRPIVGTGMETIAARDSGAVVLAKTAGEVVNVDATRFLSGLTRIAKEESHGSIIIRYVKYPAFQSKHMH